MKILMINKYLYRKGGAEIYMLKLGEELSKLGHRVEYFGMDHEDRCVGNSSGSYTRCMDFHNSSALSKLSYLFRVIYSSEARKKLRVVLENFSPDVIHINNFNYQLTPSILLEIKKWQKKGNSCRVIHTAHDCQLVCPNHICRNVILDTNCEKCIGGHYINCVKGRCIHSSRMRSVLGAAESVIWHANGIYSVFDKVICCSRFLKSKLDTLPEIKGKTVAIHNFVTGSCERKTYDKKGYILYFGRFSKEKGIETLLKVCRELPEIPFVFAGSGPLEEKINDVPNIQNVGFKQGEELERIIGEALISVHPSECYENCPFSVIESQMYGTPVIGANIGGIPEIMTDGVTGELFQSGDADALKQKLLKLWNDRSILAEYSRSCADTSFDSAAEYAERMIGLYQEQGYNTGVIR